MKVFGDIKNNFHNRKSDMIWNTASGIIDAAQSILMLSLITRICGLQDAGIFSIAYSISILMLTISRYGMRDYQVTDLKEKYDFNVYFSSRVVTTIGMMFASAKNADCRMVLVRLPIPISRALSIALTV